VVDEHLAARCAGRRRPAGGPALGIATLTLLPARWRPGGTTLGDPGSDCVVRRPDGLALGQAWTAGMIRIGLAGP
jgi:hypothetical protein